MAPSVTVSEATELVETLQGTFDSDDGVTHSQHLTRADDRLYVRGEPGLYWDLSAEGAPTAKRSEEYDQSDYSKPRHEPLHPEYPVLEYKGWHRSEGGWVLLSTDGTSWTPVAFVEDSGFYRGDLAQLGVALSDRDGKLWQTTLRALADLSQIHGWGSDEHIEAVAGQVYGEADCDPEDAERFVTMFTDIYDLASLSDADDLLGRENHERSNYVGRVKMLLDRQRASH